MILINKLLVEVCQKPLGKHKILRIEKEMRIKNLVKILTYHFLPV